jgi:hypothetical protein
MDSYLRGDGANWTRHLLPRLDAMKNVSIQYRGQVTGKH